MARSEARRPVVTVTTDFGAGSPYVAAMKAVLLEACADAVLVDVSHTIPAFDLRAAAFVLWAGTGRFGPGTVNLVVVDPGVGTDRRAIAFEVDGAYYVGPDNGVFTQVLSEASAGVARAVWLRRPEGASATFEGRDVFAPAAGALASGVPLGELGEPCEGPRRLSDRGPTILWVDAFGNLVTSLKPPVSGVRIGSASIARFARTFAEVPRGQLFHYVGSMGLVEVGVREGRADALLDAGPGTPVAAL